MVLLEDESRSDREAQNLFLSNVDFLVARAYLRT